MSHTGKLEERAIEIMRNAVCNAADGSFRLSGGESRRIHDHRPVDAGFPAELTEVVRAAYEAGRMDTSVFVRAAWAEFIDSDDMDAFVEALSELPSPQPVGDMSNAPRWNCISFPGRGMHYVGTPDGSCGWCGKSKDDIAAEPARRRDY